MNKKIAQGLIIFDHDGTLVNTKELKTHLFPGIKELLEDLSQMGFLLSVWTARSHKKTKESLGNLEIINYFENLYGGDDGLPKPHPMGLAKLSFGIPKENIIHIGDSLSDIEGAQTFGIDVIGACWSDDNLFQTFEGKTSLRCKTPSDCKKIIIQKFNLTNK